MKLRQLLEDLPAGLIEPGFALADEGENPEIKGLCTNSHACQPGDVFLGMPGTRVDGGEFWPSALESGAAAALVSAPASRPAPWRATSAWCP